jgi:thiamine-phosphate pyrophosphorylase
MTADLYKLILVTHRQEQPLTEYLKFIEKCLSSGVSSVQLREKGAAPSFLWDYALRLKSLLVSYKIPLIINDDIELARAIDADGVHLGQTDGSPFDARERLGAGKWIGLSIETEDDLERANACQVDYVAASAVFPSANKSNLRTLWGIDGLRDLVKRSKHPLIAIGGINRQNLAEVMAAGAEGCAVIGALHEAVFPAAMAAELRALVDRRIDSEPD